MSARPADPVLASALWQSYKEKHKVDLHALAGGSDGSPGLLTGCKSLDDILQPGLPYGEGGVCCISSEPEAGARELLEAVITIHLLSSHAATATIIDSVGLDLLSLFNTIKTRLSLQPHINPKLPPRNLDQEATLLLERLSISRVFSFEGLAEALSEFQAACIPLPPPDIPVPRGTVPDSQSSSQEEDLFALVDNPVPPSAPTISSALPDPPTASNGESPPNRLLIIDDLPTIFAPLQRTCYVSSSALLSSLLRSLKHITLSHPVCVVMMNSLTVPTRGKERYASPARASRADQNSDRDDHQDHHQDPDRPRHPGAESGRAVGQGQGQGQGQARGPSIFSSCTSKPLFWHVLDGVGVGMMLHLVPRGGEGRRKEEEGVGCLEVIGDSKGGRRGRFAFFEMGEGRGIRGFT
ncbi:hypothetical protein KVT40_004086 [Elsinoe batatas]|uniref:Uncharacterized protein n=1 Tax=Elsinoe batatas TaxID=2601811 RepID=A0A8K0PI85_9PEZI|nr:hypothetical protein KVT40_004086 [Elsinoe batatas]